MSGENEKISCSVCHAYLFPEDDTVYCPECGAPHHRDCYNAVGHCALEELHGTEQQYDKERERKIKEAEKIKNSEPINDTVPPKFKDNIVCQNCNNSYPSIMHRCPKCGAFNSASKRNTNGMPVFPMFDFLGGVPKDMDLGDGVTAEEAQRFVLSNTHRYIPKFAAFKMGSKVSWNWLAFLFPSAWYMSRKMYAKGIISCILLVSFSLLTLPFLSATYGIDTSAARNYFELADILSQNISLIGKAPLFLALAGSLFNTILRIIIGMFADLHYRNHTINTIKEIKESADDRNEAFRKKGGTSFFGLMIGFFAVQYLPTLISMFIM